MILSRSVGAVCFFFTTMTATTTSVDAYHPSKIGTPGKPWGAVEYQLWKDTRVKTRCYHTDVVPQIQALTNIMSSPPHKDDSNNEEKESLYDIIEYGKLLHDDSKEEDNDNGDTHFPLFAVRSRHWSPTKPSVLVTGGVHGYETSGVEGALLFLNNPQTASHYAQHFNLLVVPCVSPWGYERIQRWTSKGTDPNRSFNPEGDIVEGRSFNPEAETEESAALLQFLKDNFADQTWMCHLDLHETTDTDETEFRPAKAARDGILGSEKGEIPDGFYLVQDITSPQPEWFKAMIDNVRKVTHIAPADQDGKIIGEDISQEGVIGIPCNKSLGLCAGMTNAVYRTTTEVYPDSPKATPEQCNQAQVACIEGALDHIIDTVL